MRIAKPDAIELEYVQRMLAWMLWRPTVELAQGRAVQLGLGAGTLTRFTHRRLRMPTTVVEINPSVVDVARLWFRLPPEDDARLDVVVGDAQAWVDDDANARGATVLNVDLYDHRAASPGARRRRVLRRLPPRARRRRRDERQPVRPRRQLRRQRRAHRRRLRSRPGVAHDADPRRQLDRHRRRAASSCPTATSWSDEPPTIASRFGLPARKWLRMVRPATF